MRRFMTGSFALLSLLAVPWAAQASTVSGSTSGIWVNPEPGGATVTGVNTPNFTWGGGTDTSKLGFASVAAFDAPIEAAFKIGTITYYNGTIPGDTGATSVDLRVNLNFTDPPQGNVGPFDFQFDLINTPNTGTQDQQADYVYLPTVFPETTFTIEGVEYTLKLTGFENVTGSGFVSIDNTKFHVHEQGSASAELWAKVTTELPPPAVVPEPSTWAMGVMSLLAGLGYTWRRRQAA